jgi:hypothetical protein
MTSVSSTQDHGSEHAPANGNGHGGDKRDDLIVRVRFELSMRKPFTQAYAPTTTVGVVLRDAMNHFGVQPDPNTTYYLTAHRERQADDLTLAELAGQRDEIDFRMVKELIQGGD